MWRYKSPSELVSLYQKRSSRVVFLTFLPDDAFSQGTVSLYGVSAKKGIPLKASVMIIFVFRKNYR
jgi:hypothetical protein